MDIATAHLLPPRPDLGWTDDEWAQFEAAWTHVAAERAPPDRGFSWSIFGWGEAKKAWVAGLAGAVASAAAPLVLEGEALDVDALWRAGLGAILGYIAAWAPRNKPPPEGVKT